MVLIYSNHACTMRLWHVPGPYKILIVVGPKGAEGDDRGRVKGNTTEILPGLKVMLQKYGQG